LPDEDIEIRYLSISKPIQLKGCSGYSLTISEGPIIINIRENSKREVVKFSEIKIFFKYSAVEHIPFNKKGNYNKFKTDDKKIPLFRINPGSILFLEDCDICCDKLCSNFPYKLVCFIINSVISKKDIAEKKEEINNNNINNSNKINLINRESTKIKIRDNNIKAGNNNNLIKTDSGKIQGIYEKSENIGNLAQENEIDLYKIDINFKKIKKENKTMVIENPNKIIKSNFNKQDNFINVNSNINNFENININKKIKDSSQNPNQNYNKIAILNLISTRFSNFYQVIRSDSSIFNIEKCSFNSIFGKAVVFINPFFLRISNCSFENNFDDAIHVRYLKTENFSFESRKLIFEKNDINHNKANGFYIEGDNTHIDLDFYVLNNNITKNKFDGIFITDLSLNILIISDNKLIGNNMNGININKVYQKFNNIQIINNLNINFFSSNNIKDNTENNNINNSNNYSNIDNNLNFLIIKNNELIDNEGLGLFLNDAKAIVHNNYFCKNRNNGMFLSTINFLEIFGGKKSSSINDINETKKQNNHNINLQNQQNQYISNFNNTSTREKTISNASFFNNNFGLTIINECNFIKNNGNGLKIYNYCDIVYITNCNFSENFENGVLVEDDPVRIYNNSIPDDQENNNIKKSNVNIENKNNKDQNEVNNVNLEINNKIKVSKNIYNNNISELEKNKLLKKRIDKFKNQDFNTINDWIENILKKIKTMITNEESNNLFNSNFINFNITNFLKENILVYEKLNYGSSLGFSNLQKIFFNIFQTINQNLNLIPQEFREFNIPYVCLSHSKLESNSKSGISLSNYFLLLEGVTILDNSEFSILITKEEYKEFFKEIKGKKKNVIDNVIGGPWGIAKSSGFSCNCFNTKNKTIKRKEKEEEENINENNKNKDTNKQNKKNCNIF